MQPLTWNARQQTNSDRSLTTEFWTNWMNYHDGEKWNEITLEFTEDSTGFSLRNTPYGFSAPKNSLGGIYFQNKVNFDPEINSFIDTPPIGKTKQFLPHHDVPGQMTPEGILYSGAYDFGDILLQPLQHAVKNLVVFRTEPAGTGDIEIPFIQILDSGLTPKRKNRALSFLTQKDLGAGVDFVGDRTIYTRPSYVWDTAGRWQPVKVMAKKTGNVLDCRKIIPRAFVRRAISEGHTAFSDTVDTFTPNTADQGMSSADSTWSGVRDSGTGASLESVSRVSHLICAAVSGGTYFEYRAYLWWATGATIPSGNTISAASLETYWIYAQGIQRTYDLVENRQASTNLATGDWNNIGASGVGTGTDEPFGSFTRAASEAAGSKTFTINATGQGKIAKGSGNTFYMVIDALSWDNTTPTSSNTNGVDFSSADAASNKPTLSVTHAAPPAAGFDALLLAGD